jgi:sulfate permease, SulP family
VTEAENDVKTEASQPGLSPLRDAVGRYAARRLPGRPEPREDAVAGLNIAVANVPDGLANGVLVGVNPVFGLYATMMGPLVGGLFSSTQLMVVTTTAAASLTAGQALSTISPESREAALVVMVLLVGAVQVAAGLLGLGRLTRFVPYSVTTGFLTGVAALLVLSQLPTVAGVDSTGGNRVVQTVDLFRRIQEANAFSIALGILALALAVVLPRTRPRSLGRLLAIVLPSVLLLAMGNVNVATVADVGVIPESIPRPVIPSFLQGLDVLTGAISVAVVILVQGAGVSQSVPNPDGSRRDASRDFIAQGAANLASGLFRGLPVGGSVSTTALGVVSGARTRWTAVFSGLWMAVIVLGVPGLVGYVAMPALGALLILAGVSSVKPTEVASVWHSGWAARLAGGTTFLATLLLPIQAAVGIGVVLSALLHLGAASEVRVVELVERPDGRVEERGAPSSVANRAVTVLDVYGDLFYAGARSLADGLPSARGARHPAVVIRLRGRTAAGATLVDVLAAYAEELQRAGGRLYLTGIADEAYRRLGRSEKLHRSGVVHVYEATVVLGESTRRALIDARAWLESLDEGSASGTADGE